MFKDKLKEIKKKIEENLKKWLEKIGETALATLIKRLLDREKKPNSE